MGTPIDVAVIPRDVHFRTESVQQGPWLGGDPVATAVFNALSLTFPEGERLFIDAVRRFRGQVRGKLADDVRAFIAQEAIHAREHAALNAGLDCRRYPVEWIGESVRRRLAFLRRLGPMRMLGVTIALEHFTGDARRDVRRVYGALGQDPARTRAAVALACDGRDGAQGGRVRRVQRGYAGLERGAALPVPRPRHGCS